MSELFSQLGIDWKLLIAQAVNFLIVLVILHKFVFTKLIKLMEERRERIEKGLAMREEAEKELARAHEMRRNEIEKAKKEAEAVIAQAKTLGAERERQLVAKAREEAEKILYGAKEDIKRETQAVLQSAKEDILAMAMIAAEKVIDRSITQEDRIRMMKEVMESIEKEYGRK
ncbi:MAG: F0F1 ATP synthase subunit B [Candidatus Wildermuthbacteria bacterium]|nr:F0F1 ATP synthase subunit B [Candidatus Wildermuthbacteria bacterium]